MKLNRQEYSCYQFIFQQQYDFLSTAKTLEQVLQRLKDFIFILYTEDNNNNNNNNNNNIIPLILIDKNARELFNNVMHITLTDYDVNTVLRVLDKMRVYAKLKLRQHHAIPFTTIPEPFPLYRILADYYIGSEKENNNNNDTVILFALHARQRPEKYSIASFLRKHDLARSSTFYAYGEQIRMKLQLPHYHCTLLLACTDSMVALQKALTAFKVSYFTHFIKSNKHKNKNRNRKKKEEEDNYDNNYNTNNTNNNRLTEELFKRPKKPIAIPIIRSNTRYPILSSIEIVSLMLPDSIKGVRTTIDGIRPYTTGRMLL